MISGKIDSTYFPVYPYGEIVIGLPEYSYYYISWLPQHMTSGYVDFVYSYPYSSYDLTRNSGFVSFGSSMWYVDSFVSCTWTEIEANFSKLTEMMLKGSSLEFVNLYACKSINTRNFSPCSSLKSVYLPECEYIGNSNFTTCTLLSELSLPRCSYIGRTNFQSCWSMYSLSLPRCQHIGGYTFIDCFLLYDLSLPVCSYIEEGAFRSSPNLYGVTFGASNVCTLSASIFSAGFLSYAKYIYVPSSLVSLYSTAQGWSDMVSSRFSNSAQFYPICTESYYIQMSGTLSGASFRFGNSVYYCSDYASYYFTSFNGVIPSSAFIDCSFYSGFISTNATSIGSDAFFQCDLSKVTLRGCKVIGEEAFGWCDHLMNVCALECEYISASAFAYCTSLSEGVFPKCRVIREDAFMFCQSLNKLIAPECLSISSGAFYNCTSLYTVQLPKCKYIGEDAFKYTKVSSVLSLPDCTSIGDNAFYGCSLLQNLYVNTSTVCLIGSNTFGSTKFASGSGTIHAGSLSSEYKQTPCWSSLSSLIVA